MPSTFSVRYLIGIQKCLNRVAVEILFATSIGPNDCPVLPRCLPFQTSEMWWGKKAEAKYEIEKLIDGFIWCVLFDLIQWIKLTAFNRKKNKKQVVVFNVQHWKINRRLWSKFSSGKLHRSMPSIWTMYSNLGKPHIEWTSCKPNTEQC